MPVTESRDTHHAALLFNALVYWAGCFVKIAMKERVAHE